MLNITALRGGAATLYYPIWHYEAPELIVLKNNRGVEENRIRQLDYGIQLNKLMYERIIKRGNITLFSPNDVPGMYEAFYNDQEKFEELYTKAEADENIRKRVVPAMELFTQIMQERASTGRIYLMNVDHCNTHSPFDEKVAPIHMSNLCIEVALPTKPLDNIYDEKGEIALCILAAVNVTATTKEEMGDVCEMCVRALDALIDYQTYPVPAARISTVNRRSLGVGIINYAHFLAKNGTYYSNTTKANEITHELMELFQYSLIKASVKLAQEYGPCGWFNETKYAKGILPIDTYKKDLDDICPNDLKCDWESLRQDVLKYGMRNSTLSALMPSETSSQVANATNGIEPPRGLVSIKQSKDGILKQVVPDIKTLGLNYETAWNMQDNVGYIHKVCIMQKFVDQAISANEYYMPSRYPGGKVPMTELIKMKLLGYKYGMKTWYYHNTNDGADDRADEINAGCESGACAI